jgi:radical SAM protein with 4Fe4S-binding SPASM domain
MESSLGTEIEPVKIGDVDHGIGNTAKCQQHIHQLRNIDRFTKSTLECLECPIAEGCSDCAAYNYEDAGGKFNQKATYICVMHKARVLANCYYWNMLYHKNNENKRFKLWLSDEEALKIINQKELAFLKAL